MNKISNFQFLRGNFFSALDHEVLEEGFINSKADAENEREGAVSSMRRGGDLHAIALWSLRFRASRGKAHLGKHNWRG